MTRTIRLAEPADRGELFTLQRAAFVDEARLYETPFVPALDETFEAFGARHDTSTTWVAEFGGRIVGAVSLRDYRSGGPDIERLMVAPDCRGQGISSVLMKVAEDHALAAGFDAIQLIVGEIAHDNRAIYRHLGWVERAHEPLKDFEHVILVTMSKQLRT